MVRHGGSEQAQENTRIGRQSIRDGSLKRLRLLQRVEAQYGSDIRAMVELTLSEFTEMARSPTLTTSNRTEMSSTIWNNLSTSGLTELDKALIMAQGYSDVTGWEWSAQQSDTGVIRLTARRRMP